MAFPTVAVQVRREFVSSATTTHNVLMPTPIGAGDLIVVKFYNTGTSTVAATGFGEIGTSANVARLTELEKIAVGDEGGTNINFVTSEAQFAFAHVIVVDAASWFGDTSTGLAIAFATGTSATPDPPNLAPAWGAADTLWLPSGGKDDSGTITSAPTNYTDLLGGDNFGSAQRELNAASENPGTFGGANSHPYVASTLAVRPAAPAATLEAEGFRIGRDDGSESGHGWYANQDVPATVAPGVPFGVRKLIVVAGDLSAGQFTFRYKRGDEADSEKRVIG